MLEQRQLLAGDVVEVMPHHNYWAPNDVNQDARISPLDALAVVNDLNRNGSRPLTSDQFAPTNFIDVNNDGYASPIDALRVVNSLNRGVPEAVGEVVELQVGVRDLNDNNMLATGSRTVQVSPGEIFKLDLIYKDLRSPLTDPRGLASAYVDFLVNQPTALEPVVTETVIADFSINIMDLPTGSMTIGAEGTSETVVVTGEQFNTQGLAPIQSAIQEVLNLTTPPLLTAEQFVGDPVQPDILRVTVRYQGAETYNVDIPNLTIDTSNLNVQGDPVTVDGRVVPAVLPDGSVNGEAVAYNVLVVSRTNGQAVYSQAVDGSYHVTDVAAIPPQPAEGGNPAVPGSPAIEAGFNEVGGFTSDFGIDGYPTNDPFAPFHAFSLLVRAVEPALGVIVEVDPPEEEDRRLIMQNVDQAVPNSQILIDLDDSASIAGDDRPGLVVINIVETVTAQPDSLVVQEDSSGTVNVLTNDLEVDNRALSIASFTQPAHGTVTFNGGVARYTPTANYFGPDSFTYTARNADGDLGVGTVTVNVTAINDPPVFTVDGTRNATEDTSRTFPIANLLTNDTVGPLEEGDVNQSLSVTAVTLATQAGGQATLSGGDIAYVPPTDFFGTDRIFYTISDGVGGTTTGTMTVLVAAVNDAPVLHLTGVNAVEDTSTTFAQSTVLGTSVPGPQNESSQTLLITAAGTGGLSDQGGTVSLAADGQITYKAAPDFFGTDTFTVTVTDSGGESASATLTVTVAAVNDAPTANPDTFVVDESVDGSSVNNVLDVLDNDSAGPGEESTQTIRVTSVTADANGTATIGPDGQSILFTPNEAFIGTATLTYGITDSGNPQKPSQTATVTVEVVPILRPRAMNDTVAMTEGDSATSFVLTGNDLVEDGDTAEIVSLGNLPDPATEGTLVLNGTTGVTFTPVDDDFNGQVTFTYVLDFEVDTDPETDQLAAATGTVTINIAAVNDPPVSVDDPVIDAVEDTALEIDAATDLLANDDKGAANESDQTLSVSAVAATADTHGTVTLDVENQTILYTPSPNYNGSASFTYTILDSEGETTTGTAQIAVDAVNDAPILSLNELDATEDDLDLLFEQSEILGTSKPGPVTATDEAGQTLSVIAVGNASGETTQGGTVSINGFGQIVYNPADDFFGTDTFAITVEDSGGATTEGIVTVEVAAVNDAPELGDPPLIAFTNGTITYTQAQLLEGSTAGPNEGLTPLSVTGAAAVAGVTHGTIVFNGDGTVTYTPDDDFIGEAQFQLTLSDGDLTTTGLVTVDVKEFEPSVISGSVFFDYIASLSNQVRNGVQDAGEPGLQMAYVRLVSSADANVTGGAINLRLATDAAGDFQFNNVPPGTYRLIFELPEMVYDGADFAGTVGDLDTVQNQFTIQISEPGGIAATGYNFTLYGTKGGAGSALDMLVSSWRNGATGGSNSELALLGATAVINPNGSTSWFRAGDGFEGVKYGEINLNSAANTVSLTVVMEDGTQLTGWVPSDQFVIVRDRATGDTVVRIFGGLDDFNLVPDGMLDTGDAGLLSYQAAVDELLSQNDSVI